MRTFNPSLVLCLYTCPLLAGGSTPSLQWVKSFPTSGQSLATASAVDAQGNLYITGNTYALDFPAVSAGQSQPGGSPLTRFDAASGIAQRLYSPMLANAGTFTVDPRNPSVLYAVSTKVPASGDGSNPPVISLIRSPDGGQTWTPLGALPATSVSCLVIDPFASGVIYACGGYQGMFKTVDGGMTWAAIGNFKIVFQAWADPRTPSVLFAGYDTLMRSDDGGATWTTVLSNTYISYVSYLAFDPSVPGTIYQAGHTTVNKSTDDGRTWTPLAAPPATVDKVWTDPIHPGTLYFAPLANDGGLYQSTDGGTTWTRKLSGLVNWLAFDTAHGTSYAITGNSSQTTLVSSDGFNSYDTWQAVKSGTQIIPAGPVLFVAAPPSSDVFVTKLAPDGNIVYSTYFGGSSMDTAAAMAVGTDGSVYVTGATQSPDFPTTPGTFLSDTPSTGLTTGGAFVFKLNADGALAWSTFFADSRTNPEGVAVNANGELYVTGNTNGGLPVTPGAYVPNYPGTNCSGGSFFCVQATPGFLARLKSDGSGIVAATYIATIAALPGPVPALALDADGNAYVAGGFQVWHFSADATALLASSEACISCTIRALAVDPSGNLYATGSTRTPSSVPTTPSSFQPAPQPAIPQLLLNPISPIEAFVLKCDPALNILAATLLGGELYDQANSIVIDSNGNVVVAGDAQSKAFPTRSPFQLPFSGHTGFVAALDANLSTLLYSTFLGDRNYFTVAGAAADSQGNILLAGSTLASSLGSGCLPTPCLSSGVTIYANKISLSPTPDLRLDSVGNAASQLPTGLSPDESIAATGAGFGPDADLLLNGVPLPVESRSASRIVARIPQDLEIPDTATMTVSSGGAISNPVMAPAMPSAPGIYSADGTGYGQGYILNSDGTLNSPSNPAALGSAITIFATGVGRMTQSGPYAITEQPVSVFIDGFYSNGIAATVMSIPGMATDAYAISVYVPNPADLVVNNPDLKNFKMPPQVPLSLAAGPILPANPAYSGSRSQPGLSLSVTQ